MSARKTIQINPDFFSLSGSKKSKKKAKTPKKKPAFKPNNIKKQLLAKIKEHQKQKEIDNNMVKAPEILQDDFDNSMQYVQKMIKEKTHKKTVKKRHRTKKQLPNKNLSISNDPPYGCLKNGNKPTFSQYKKTLKRNKPIFQNSSIQINTTTPIQQTPIQQTPIQQTPIQQTPIQQTPMSSMPQEIENKDDNLSVLNPVLNRKMKLEKLKDKFMETKKKPSKRLVKRNKTIKIYNLGKNNKKRSVGVLIKSGKTRKKIKKEHDVLKKRCLSDIKHYLRKHNLIKVGTSAPENVLRNLYENSNLSGDIYNKNVTTLLHNFMKEA
jgi:hypothetical protein